MTLTPDDFHHPNDPDTTLRRRADKALEAHLWLVDMHHRDPGCQKVVTELLVDTPSDLKEMNLITDKQLGRASTHAITTEMFSEILLGEEFLAEGMEDESSIEMALTEEMLPNDVGIVVFPYGVELPLWDGGIEQRRIKGCPHCRKSISRGASVCPGCTRAV